MRFLFVVFGAWLLFGLGETEANEVYQVSSGVLAVDAGALRAAHGIDISDEHGARVGGVSAMRPSLAVTRVTGQSGAIGRVMTDLAVFDDNGDDRIDNDDSVWNQMYLVVDYNRNGRIEDREYALIGDCGVRALTLDMAEGKAWSLHTGGRRRKAVSLTQL